VLQKLLIRPVTPSNNSQLQLTINGSSSLGLLVNAGSTYVTKALNTIKSTMLESPVTHAIQTIEFLNANNAILAKSNAQLVATARACQDIRKGKKTISKARLLSKDDADELRATKEAKEAADEAHRLAIV
jgi:ABC-type transport system involved in Fe-S cluster assembly fused permease/ATPase subunit